MSGDELYSFKDLLTSEVEAIQRWRNEVAAEKRRRQQTAQIPWIRIKPQWQVEEEEKKRRRSERISRKLAADEAARKAHDHAKSRALSVLLIFKTERDSLLQNRDEVNERILTAFSQSPFEEEKAFTALKLVYPKINNVRDFLDIHERRVLEQLRNRYLDTNLKDEPLAQRYFTDYTNNLVQLRSRRDIDYLMDIQRDVARNARRSLSSSTNFSRTQ